MKDIPLSIGLLVSWMTHITLHSTHCLLFISFRPFRQLIHVSCVPCFPCSESIPHRIVCGEVDALRALLAAGADVTITDLNGGSPVWIHYNPSPAAQFQFDQCFGLKQLCFRFLQLHYAAQMSNGNQQQSAQLALEILEIFLQQPNVQVDVCDKDGRQPLLWAASAGAVKAVLVRSKLFELILLFLFSRPIN